ncbi:MAG TPA: Ig-like domain-containing protein, partial [Spirochaetota bacterium]|nr:Ig-like domain-containing protein [Spirochaetota bacterium]
TISSGLVINLEVTAHDPEGKPLSYTFASEAGNFGNIKKTATGCTAEFYTRNVIGGASVNITISVEDEKHATDTWRDWNVGKGRSGPMVKISIDPKEYIRPDDYTSFEFYCDSDGYYQILCSNSATEQTIAVDDNQPIYMYTPSADVSSPKRIASDIVGYKLNKVGRIKLPSADDGPYCVWLLFWDGLKQYDIKKIIINQDGTPPTFVNFTPTGDDTGVRTNIDAVFSEPVSIDDPSNMTVKDSTGTDATNRFNPPVSAGNSVLLSSKSDLDYYETYTASLASGTEISDRAGNIMKISSANNATFTTVALGTLPAPVFRNVDQSAVTDGFVYDYSPTASIHAVCTGTVPGTYVEYTKSVGGSMTGSGSSG